MPKKVPELSLTEILSHEPPLTTLSRETLTRRIKQGKISASKRGADYYVKLTQKNLAAIADRERAPKTPKYPNDNNS